MHEQTTQEAAKKLAYHAPKIIDYGTLQENTQQGSLCICGPCGPCVP